MAWWLTTSNRLILARALCLAAAATAYYFAWTNLDDPRRLDGNGGHVNIDFAGQWMLGRLLLDGAGAELYDRHAHQLVLARAYPADPQVPTEAARDHERLCDSLPGRPDYPALETLTATVAPLAGGTPLGVLLLVAALPSETELVAARRARQLAGPLYPPIHAYVMLPMAFLSPRTAYRTTQVLNLVLVFLLGLGAAAWSRGRFWWPVATLLLMLFPGFAGTINLGQNPLVTLGIIALGWWLVRADRPGLGGIMWGLLAFKPVWAVTFFVVALATRRWRMAFSMAATGLLLILVTLPLGGLRPWFDWLEMGKLASDLYARDKGWVLLSRDVQNLPRRVLLDFPPTPGLATSRHGSLPDLLGVSLWATVVLLWLVGLIRLGHYASQPEHRQGEGPDRHGTASCFILLGAWLACWHFMYYDTLVAALPVFLCLRRPGHSIVPAVVLVMLIVCHYTFEVLDPHYLGPPCDTLLLLVLWAWSWFAALRTLRESAPPQSVDPLL